MPFGLTNQGLNIKRLSDIKAEIQASLRTYFGPGINLLETEFLGIFIGIFAERHAVLEELIEGVYNSFYPDTADGINLDNVVAITGIKRLEATSSEGQGIAYGTLGTTIPAGSIVSVVGNSTAAYRTKSVAVIGAGIDEVQDIDFSAVPDAGIFTLVYEGEETANLPFNASAGNIQTALNNLPSLSGVTVAGNFTSGFTVTFAGSDGQKPQSLLLVGANTLTNTSIAVAINIVETTEGVLPNVTIDIIAVNAGVVPGFANSITVIETPVSGWVAFNNPNDVELGKDIESDADLRLRREQTLATAGASTEEAIRARVLEIDEVTACRVFSNRTLVVDAFGRPPKSFETIVLGGDEQEIADTIWLVAPAGIEIFGDITKTVVDSQGFNQIVKFSRPTQVPIYIIITLVTDASFPIGGEDAVKEAVANYGDENFGIGDDVITTMLFCAIHTVQGILDITIDIGTAPAPVGDANIPIADDEIAYFDTTNITVI